jgi:HK97 family phage portal protein
VAETGLLSVLARGLAPVAKAPQGPLSSVDSNRGWWPIIRESFTGAWQRNETVSVDTALTNPVLFRCITVIANDIANLRLRLVELDPKAGVWSEVTSSAFSPVLKKPNRYQTRVQFVASWMISRLAWGNTYVLKERDARGVVVRLHVLDPGRVKPLIAPDGAVYYQLDRDDLSGLQTPRLAAPASEIIHDRWNTLFHPLVGLSPIYACGLAALQAQEIQNGSIRFFRNGSRPGGVLTAPDTIDDVTAARLKEHWETNYTGENAGRIAVLGDGLEFKEMAFNAVDSQLIERLKWTGATICGTFGVPAYMAGVGEAPLNNNVQSLRELYYAQCLQPHIEGMEACLDEGLGLLEPKEGRQLGVEVDLDDLLRMDAASQMEALDKGKNILTPDEARKKLNLGPTPGGDVVYRQQQDYSLAALAKRDAKEDPFAKTGGEPPAAQDAPQAANDDPEAEAQAAAERAAAAKAQARLDAYELVAATKRAIV